MKIRITGTGTISTPRMCTLLAPRDRPRKGIFMLGDAAEMAACPCAQAVRAPVARMVMDAAEWSGERTGAALAGGLDRLEHRA